jgi:chromosomal replication initiator protein
MTPLPTIASIQRGVAREYRVPVRVMREPDSAVARDRQHCRPRQVAITLAVRLTDHSLSRIGHYFGHRDHTTIMYALHAVERRRRKGGREGHKIHNTMRRLTLELVRK